MLLSSLLLIPIIGVFAILVNKDNKVSTINIKFIALTSSILNLFVSLIIFILFDFSTNQFQFVQEYHEISYFDFYLGIDGLSIYFILLTTIIIPISLLSNWTSISKDVESYVIIILLLETLLLAVFLVLDILLFYIFFESILPPLFILIGIFGSDNRVKASFYLFLYTLLGSLFLLLSILAMSSIMSTTDFDTLFKGNFIYLTQLFLFYGIFIAFAVKTPTIFLNTWLLKAHVESPLGGSIILAAIVLKLSLYGILRLILPVLPKAYMEYTYIIFLIGVITIVYASLSTLRTIDVKELIAYSSVSHAAVYLLGVFSNNIQGIEGSINLGLAHGLVSPGLFICAGGILYDRSHTRLIALYRGMAQIMPLFAILFFILCLANCGAPLSLNFIGEFLSLYGIFETSTFFGLFASSSIIFSAAYTMFMYQKITFGGSLSRMFTVNIPDLNKREFMVLFTLVVPTVLFGIYPAPILDAIHYSVSTLIYSLDMNVIGCDASRAWGLYFEDTHIFNLSGSNGPEYSYFYLGLSLVFAKPQHLSLGLQSSIPHILISKIIKSIGKHIVSIVKKALFNKITLYLQIAFLAMLKKYPDLYSIVNKSYFTINNYYLVLCKIVYYLQNYLHQKYPVLYSFCLYIYTEYIYLFSGSVSTNMWCILTTYLIFTSNQEYIVLYIVLLFNYFIKKELEANSKLISNYPIIRNLLISVCKIINIVIVSTLLNTILIDLIFFAKKIIAYVLKMATPGSNDPQGNNPSSPNNQKTPGSSNNPNNNNNTGYSDVKGKKKKTRSKKPLSEEESLERMVEIENKKQMKALNDLQAVENNHTTRVRVKNTSKDFLLKYHKWLPADVKKEIKEIEAVEGTGLRPNDEFLSAPNVLSYWKLANRDTTFVHKMNMKKIQLYQKNAKRIQIENLGGTDSTLAKNFKQELEELNALYVSIYKAKNTIIKDQIKYSSKPDSVYKKANVTVRQLIASNILM